MKFFLARFENSVRDSICELPIIGKCTRRTALAVDGSGQDQCLFHAPFWGIPTPELIIFSPNGCEIVRSKSFFSGQDDELQLCITQNSLLVDNKHRKLFVIQQPKGCKFMPKMHQNTFDGRAPPGPAGDALPRSYSHEGGGIF